MSEIIERRLSFAGGEMDERVLHRVDLEKYHSGCKKLRNMLATAYGSANRRPGSEFICDTGGYYKKNVVRLEKFVFSTTTTRVLAFGDLTFRVVNSSAATPGWEMSGDDVFELDTPWTVDEIFDLHFAQINDVVYITHPNHRPRLLRRLGVGNWELTTFDEDWPAVLDRTPGNVEVTIDANSFRGEGVTLASSADLFNAGHVGSAWTITHRRTDIDVEMELGSVGDPDPAPGNTSRYLFCLGSWSATIAVDAAAADHYDVKIVIERTLDPGPDGTSGWETHRTLSSSKDTPQVIMAASEDEPCFLRLKYVTKTGGVPGTLKAKLELSNPDHTGIVRITGVAGPRSATCNVITPLFIEGGSTDPAATKRWAEPAWSGYRGYPRSIAFHESRLFFGGTATNPQTVWSSRINKFNNFRTGSADDLGLSFQAISKDCNTVNWLLSGRGLAVGTNGEEWVYSTRDSAKGITPLNGNVQRQSAYGSAHIQAVAVDAVAMFVNRAGSKLYEFAFDFSQDGFVANELTLFLGLSQFGGIKQLALQKDPDSSVFAVTKGGQIAVLVYDRAQKISGWSILTTSGSYESIAVVPGGSGSDHIWVVVRRIIDGAEVRYIERFQPNQIELLRAADLTGCKDMIYLDAATKYSGLPATEITGLDHLTGQHVDYLADGSPGKGQVLGGVLTLDSPASTVVVGLPFTSIVETSYLESSNPSGNYKIANKRVTGACLDLYRTVGASVSGNSGVTWERIPFSDIANNMDEPVPVFSGLKDIKIESNSRRQTTLSVKQDLPLPMNLSAGYVRFEVNQT